ncbi:MAG: hypothetical protein H6659_14370 [Ardenticatenaceae bacterium]|nr:hypothetical protein [Ardenticatenaceae bacterium]MCB8987941.1 hypothetical protein [Ardenticatenaceae bacterium]
MNSTWLKEDRPRRWWVAGLVFIILVTAVSLRFHLIDTTGIWGDQSFTLNTALRWVKGGEIPLAANKSSVGIMNPPMIEYLYAAALRLWADVLSVAWLTLAAGLAALALAAWAAYRVFGWRAGLWTLALFAFNPWSVLYSQQIWNQTMLPVFAALTLAMLLLYFAVRPSGIYLVLAFVGAACMTQVHPGSAMQLGTMGVIMLLFWRRLRPWPLAAGILLFVLLYVPFWMYEKSVGWQDVTAMLAMAGEPSTFGPAAVLVSLDLLHAKGLLPTAVLTDPHDAFMTILFALSLVITLLWGGRQFWRRRQDEQAQRYSTAVIILFLWLLVPVLFYLRTAVYLQVYYLMGQWPAPFILMGLAVALTQQWLERPWRRPWGRWASLGLAGLLIVLLAVQVILNLQIQNARLSENRIQIRHVRQAITRIDELTAVNPDCPLVLVSEGHQIEISRLALLQEFTTVPTLLLTDGELALPLPAPCALYLDARPGSRASNWLAETAVPLPHVDLTVQNETWRFYQLSSETRAQVVEKMQDGRQPDAWTNGAALVQWQRGDVQPGDPLPLTLLWQVSGQPPHKTYHTGAYLLTPDNQVVAQADGPGFDSIQWRQGDYFLTWFQISVPPDLPPGTYRLALAQYTWPTLERIDLAAGDNTLFLEDMTLLEP